MSERSGGRSTLAAVAILAVVTCWLFLPIVLGAASGQPRFFEWDVPEQYWPDQVYLCSSLHDGRLPLWNPFDRGGYPYFADPQAATWHPFSWLVCGVGGASPGPGWMTARVVLGFFAAGLFGLLWLRRLGLPPGPALLGATVIEAAPFMRHNWELNLTFGLALLPLMLWAAERLATERRLRDGALLALAVTLCGLAGSPPALWQASTFCGVYLVGRSVVCVRAEGRRAIRPLLAALGVSAVLTAMMLAVVLVPALGLASRSVQAGNDLASISAGALDPSDLLALVWPMPGNHLYVGLVPLLLALLAVVRPPASGTPGRWIFVAAAALAVLMCLGQSTPLFGLAWRLVPGVDLFRLPHRYEAWLGPAMGALAAFGLMRVGQWRPGTIRLPVAGVLALLVLVDVSRVLPVDRHTRTGGHPGLDESALERLPDDAGRWRYMDEFGVSCRSGTRLGRRDLRGYQDPLQLRSYERIIGSLREHPRMAEQLSVRWALTGPHFIHGWDRHFLPPRQELLAIPGARDLGGGVIELPEPVPSAFWVSAGAVGVAPDRAAALARVRAAAPAMVAVLEQAADVPSPVAGPRGPPRPAVSFELEPDRVVIEIEAPGPGVVVVNEAWYPGWRARVDGVEAPVWRANGFVRAVPVAAGARRIELEFRPAGGRALRWLMLAGLLLALGLALSGRRSIGQDHPLEVPDGPSDDPVRSDPGGPDDDRLQRPGRAPAGG